MVNNCKYFYLGKCKRVKKDWFTHSCIYMTDPQACPQYEEEFTKQYRTPSATGKTKE